MMRSALLVLIVLLALGCAASADVIVNDTNYASLGWVAAIENGGAANPGTINFLPEMTPAPAGIGSLHMQTRYDDSDQLQKVYFGTNNYSGTALADITSLKVSTYLRYRDYSVGLPPIMELITYSPSQQRKWWYVPNASAIQFQTWQEWDLTAAGTTQGQWMLMNSSSTNYKGDWAWLKTRYANPVFATPNVGDYVAGGVVHTNQSGTSISFKIGAGKANISGTEATMYNGGSGSWWQTSCAINGYVDKFVIGVGGVDTVYDFEPVPEPGAFLALATGLVGLVGVRRRKG